MSVASQSYHTGSIKSRGSSGASSFKERSASGSVNKDGRSSTAMQKVAQEKALDDKYKLPEFKVREQGTQKKDAGSNMYIESQLGFSKKDIKSRKKRVEDELSIFAPHAADGPVLEKENDIKIERPITPINREIRKQPHNWEQMSQYVRRRIAPDKNVGYLSNEDQTDLAEILVAETYHIWPEIKRQIDDPFLTPADNKELNRRIAVHIVTVCEQLYKHYLEKAEILMKRGVFSGPANMSRLKAQLGIEASKYLNILIIRRYIVADMKGDLMELESVSDVITSAGNRPMSSQHTISKMSFKGMLKQSRPKKEREKRVWRTAEEHLQEIKENMPELETTKLLKVIADMPRELLDDGPLYEQETVTESVGRKTQVSHSIRIEDRPVERLESDKQLRRKILTLYQTSYSRGLNVQRSNSLPEISGESLIQELGIDQPVIGDGEERTILTSDKKRVHKTSYELLYEEKSESPAPITEKPTHKSEVGLSRDFINQDLQKLVEIKIEPEIPISEEDDLPPLLQALVRHRRHDGMEEVYNKQIKELNEKEQIEREERSKPLEVPEHAQPGTTAQRLPNQTIVRTSDIRVSERVCMESITINQYKPVFNDLLDEIDSATVKKLDSNLFLGEEIKEVYSEIMKTVPTDHLNTEQDQLIQKAPTSLDMNGLLASASLTKKKKSERMINPNLKVHHEAPWGAGEKMEWSKTPAATPKNSKGGDNFDPLIPNHDNIAFAGDPHSGKIGGINLTDLPAMVAERMARSYANWLTWWKGNINSEDYMKYLSTRETDFLGVINHFYDSDAEEDGEDDPVSSKAELLNIELEKMRAKKLAELRQKKSDYNDGVWNINAVTLGGLGKDPDVEDDEDIKRIKAAIQKEVIEAQSKKKVLGDVLKDRSRSPGSRNMTPYTAGTGFDSRITSAITGKTGSGKGAKKPPSLQDRMEKVWNSIHMPDNLKLDMAIKYSSEKYMDNLEEVISAWEAASRLILQREAFITELEKFERLASDPNRFFENGYQGSSNARFKESRFRNQIHLKIENIHKGVNQAVKYVKDTYGDVVTYQGRPYLEKMKHDKTEMLYWLQEERKQNASDLYKTFTKQQALNQNQTLEI